MATSDNGSISVDDLLAAVGNKRGSAPSRPSSNATHETTEHELLYALGLTNEPPAPASQPAAAQVTEQAAQPVEQPAQAAGQVVGQQVQDAPGAPQAQPVSAVAQQWQQEFASAQPGVQQQAVQGVIPQGGVQYQQTVQPLQQVQQPGAVQPLQQVQQPQVVQAAQAQQPQQAVQQPIQQAQQVVQQPIQPVQQAAQPVQQPQQSQQPQTAQIVQAQPAQQVAQQPVQQAQQAQQPQQPQQAQVQQQPFQVAMGQMQPAAIQPLQDASQSQQVVQTQLPSASPEGAVQITALEQGKQLPAENTSQTISVLEPSKTETPQADTQKQAADVVIKPVSVSPSQEEPAKQETPQPQVQYVPSFTGAGVQQPQSGQLTPAQQPQAAQGPQGGFVDSQAAMQPQVSQQGFAQQGMAPAAAPLGYAQPTYQQGYVQPVASQEIEDVTRTSKVAHVVGAILIFLAIACVAIAACLLTGVFDLAAFNSNSSVISSTQVSGQASPSATNADAANAQNGGETKARYSYVIRGADGGTHEAIETATFNSDGKLVSSKLEIGLVGSEDPQNLLDQLKQQFGSNLIDSETKNNKVVCTIKFTRDDLDQATYTELLSSNVSEFKVL